MFLNRLVMTLTLFQPNSPKLMKCEAKDFGDITTTNNSSLYSTNTGIRHTTQGTNDGGVYGTTGNVVIEIHTGSLHFTDGVNKEKLPSGVVSQSLLNDLTNQVNQLKNINTKHYNYYSMGYVGT